MPAYTDPEDGHIYYWPATRAKAEELAQQERIERMQRMMQAQWDNMTDDEARAAWNAWCA